MDVTVSELLELFLQSPLVTWVSLQSGLALQNRFLGSEGRTERSAGLGRGRGKKFGMGGKRLPSWRTGPATWESALSGQRGGQ